MGMESVKGSCAQCGSICATDRSFGRPFTEVTRPANEFRPAVKAMLCECCDNPRDPANTIARECAEAPAPVKTRITHVSGSSVWTFTDAGTGAELGTVYREIGDSDANIGMIVFKAFPNGRAEAHFADMGKAQEYMANGPFEAVNAVTGVIFGTPVSLQVPAPDPLPIFYATAARESIKSYIRDIGKLGRVLDAPDDIEMRAQLATLDLDLVSEALQLLISNREGSINVLQDALDADPIIRQMNAADDLGFDLQGHY